MTEWEIDDAAARSVAEYVERAISNRDVSWNLVVQLSGLTALNQPGSEEMREVGERYQDLALEIYEAEFGAEVGLFPPIGGVTLHPDGTFNCSIVKREIRFDWASAASLLFRIELLAEEAREWWPAREVRPGSGELLARISTLFRRAINSSGSEMARRPHSIRAFNLTSWVVEAIQQENPKHSVGPSDSSPPPAFPAFEADLAPCRGEVTSAQARFRDAVQRTAQSRYWQGALAGAVLLGLFCIALGLIFWWRGTSAEYLVAVPAGGLGAMVSLLQRMSSGKLNLDVDASRDLLEVFGMVRPLIGAIFGAAVMALLLGGLVPAVTIPEGREIAFFAGVGFLAGFNERWAQDMLKTGAKGVGGSASDRDQPPAPAPG